MPQWMPRLRGRRGAAEFNKRLELTSAALARWSRARSSTAVLADRYGRSVADEGERVKTLIRSAFATTPRPANAELRGSSEGDEPWLVQEEFSDKHDWRALDAAFLDRAPQGLSSALSFFSREAFRYFLPAFLIADLDDSLETADPAFHLWHGLTMRPDWRG